MMSVVVVVVAAAVVVVNGLFHSIQACFFLPEPPNFTMSKQFTVHSLLLHMQNSYHNAFVLYLLCKYLRIL